MIPFRGTWHVPIKRHVPISLFVGRHIARSRVHGLMCTHWLPSGSRPAWYIQAVIQILQAASPFTNVSLPFWQGLLHLHRGKHRLAAQSLPSGSP